MDWLNKEEPSALLLQETYMTEQEERKGMVQKVVDVQAPGYQIFSAGLDDEKRKGVAVILSKVLVPLVRKDHIIVDKEARYIAIPCRTLVKGQLMWLVSIYAPVDAREKAAFYGHKLKKLSDDMLEIASANDIVVIGMDANATRDPIMDVEWEKYEMSKKNERMEQLRKDSVLLGEWMGEMDMVDTWHRLYPGQRVYTRQGPGLMQAGPQQEEGKGAKLTVAKRLDYIRINKAFEQVHMQTEVSQQSVVEWSTDHALLSVTLMNMPLIRVKMRNIYQRPIFKLDKLGGLKTDLQFQLTNWLRQAELKPDGLAWLSDQIGL